MKSSQCVEWSKMQAAWHESAETAEYVPGIGRLAAKEESGEDVAQTCVMESEKLDSRSHVREGRVGPAELLPL